MSILQSQLALMAAVRNSKQQQQQQRSRTKSLCKRSTEIALNITRLSFLHLSRLTLGRHRPTKNKRSTEVPVLLEEVLHEGERVESTSKTSKKYVMEPDGVDSLADEFIQRVRERIRVSDAAVGQEVSKCLPPPPSFRLARYSKDRDDDDTSNLRPINVHKISIQCFEPTSTCIHQDTFRAQPCVDTVADS